MREQVIEILNNIKPGDWENSENIIEDGGFESMEIFMLINQLGMVFGIEIDFTEMDPEVLSTVDNIVEMIEKHI